MQVLGQPLNRIDGRLKVTGSARYAGEFTAPGMLHAALVESAIGAGQIAGFDLTEAQAMPGVVLIITPRNAIRLGGQNGTPQTVHAPLLQDMTVYYNGQHVAVVVADTLDHALAAAASVRVHYQPGEPVTRMEAGTGPGLRAETFPQWQPLARFPARRSRNCFQQRGRPARSHLHNTHRKP